jgi:hypothetical protein
LFILVLILATKKNNIRLTIKMFMKYYYLSFFLLFFFGNIEMKAQQIQSTQLEKYCSINELISMYDPISNEILTKIDVNKSNNLSLIDGIGVSFNITASENINQYSENELKQAFNLLNHENVNVILNSFELKVSFNTCIRIEYVKDRLKNLDIEIKELTDTNIFLSN